MRLLFDTSLRREGLEILAAFGLGGVDLTYEKPLHFFAVSLRSMNLPIPRKYFSSNLTGYCRLK